MKVTIALTVIHHVQHALEQQLRVVDHLSTSSKISAMRLAQCSVKALSTTMKIRLVFVEMVSF